MVTTAPKMEHHVQWLIQVSVEDILDQHPAQKNCTRRFDACSRRWATDRRSKYYAFFASCRDRGLSFEAAKTALRLSWEEKGASASSEGTRSILPDFVRSPNMGVTADE